MRTSEIYQQKLTSAERAVASIKSGQRVFVGSNAATPQTLIEALTARAPNLADVEIITLLTLGVAPYTDPKYQDSFRHRSLFIGANVRQAVNECRADYMPIFLSEVPALFRRGQFPIDYALVHLSPPDEHGFCSMGVSVDVVKAAVESARHVIAEVNPKMPRTLGDSIIHLSQIHAIIESDRDIPELPRRPTNEIAQRIGSIIADMIPDGATLQMGIGSIPDAVISYLGEKNDLGVHTEMFSDGVIPLVEAGVINNRKKTLHPGKMIVTFCMGSRKLYDFIDNNPFVEFRPTEYVNDPFVIAQNDRMVAINSAIEVDLTGQVSSDSIGYRFYSGFGGQVDFVRGASRSREGKPIIALNSTVEFSNGDVRSRIVPHLQEGAGVVTSRADVHYVATEWGVAYLHGKSVRERVLALISIAHPDFRSELLDAAKKRKYVLPDQSPLGLLQPYYPKEYERAGKLPDGTNIFIRPVKSIDEDAMREFFYSLSDDTVYRRYRESLKSMPHRKLQQYVSLDYEHQFALLAVNQHETREEIVGEARYYLDEENRYAEIALMVRDDWQDRGVGTMLFEQLTEVGKNKQLAGFDAFVQVDNYRMVDMALRHGYKLQSQEDGTCFFRMTFAPQE